MFDKSGLIVDQTGDGGDSCNFHCTAKALGWKSENPNAIQLFWNDGSPVRHPYQSPWNNPANFTKDQAIPLMQVLKPDEIEYFLNMNQWFFPNLERDAVGSVKMMRPHIFYKDSRPSPITIAKKFNVLKWKWEAYLPDAEYFLNGVSHRAEIEEKSFDWADLMTPDFKGMCQILMGNKNHWIVPIGRAHCKLSIDSFCKVAKEHPDFDDFKQLYFLAKAYDLHGYFANQHPQGLHYAATSYFTEVRNLPLLTSLFYTEFQREGLYERKLY